MSIGNWGEHDHRFAGKIADVVKAVQAAPQIHAGMKTLITQALADPYWAAKGEVLVVTGGGRDGVFRKLS